MQKSVKYPPLNFNKLFFCLTIALYFIAFLIPTALFADTSDRTEKILNFHSVIIVNQDASVDITEVLSVNVRGNKIIHGIVRYLPTRFTDSYGITRHTQYNLKQVRLNQTQTDYHIKKTTDQLAVYIGSSAIFLKPGTYVYTLRYHVDNAVNFLRDADELYWNITGNNWEFPILKAQADITLPKNASIVSYAGYTGITGAKGQDFIITHPAANRIIFTTTKSMLPGEGLTIAVAWPKGFVIQPSWVEQLKSQTRYLQFSLLTVLILMLSYFLFVWHLYGKDPHKGPIIPLFDPPQNLSPAALRYIYRMGFDKPCFTASIVSLATKGLLTINQNRSNYTLKKTAQSRDDLAEEEKSLAANLFSQSESVEINRTNAKEINDAESKLKLSLKNQFKYIYFNTNKRYLLPAICLTVIAYVLTMFNVGEPGFLLIWLAIWTMGCVFLCLKLWDMMQLAFKSLSFAAFLAAFFMLIFTLPFLIAEVIVWYKLADDLPALATPLLISITLLNFIFYPLLKQPTLTGRKLMDQIEGFKLFLGTTERYRLEAFHPPQQTPALFEKNLPYAIALNVENEWSAQFNEALLKSGKDFQEYQPSWYSGPAWNKQALLAFPASLNSGLSSSLQSISVSSSGSGGGGSSGGGSGGGGGGGGW